jgi:hypothetical protein
MSGSNLSGPMLMAPLMPTSPGTTRRNDRLPWRDSWPAWAKELERRLLLGNLLPTDRYWLDPTALLKLVGITPYPWQERLLASSSAQMQLLCARQSGKSLTMGAIAANALLVEVPCFAIVMAQNEEKSKEFLYKKVRPLLIVAGSRFAPGGDLKTSLTLANGSRILAVAESEKGVRGYSDVNLLVLDEASRIPDETCMTCRPMLAASRGRLVTGSTPFGKRGWFFEEWQKGGADWHRECVTAYECPHYSHAFLAREKEAMGERWFNQEYLVNFVDAIGSVFSEEDIRAACRPDVPMIQFREPKGK